MRRNGDANEIEIFFSRPEPGFVQHIKYFDKNTRGWFPGIPNSRSFSPHSGRIYFVVLPAPKSLRRRPWASNTSAQSSRLLYLIDRNIVLALRSFFGHNLCTLRYCRDDFRRFHNGSRRTLIRNKIIVFISSNAFSKCYDRSRYGIRCRHR